MGSASSKTRFTLAAVVGAALIVFFSLAPASGDNARPAFDGKSLSGWHSLGGEWRVDKGEIVGTARPGPGWLVHDEGYQDMAMTFSFRCVNGCQSGVLIGMQKDGANTKGLFISLAEGDLSAYEMTIDAQGQEISRQKPPAPEGRGGRGGGGGGRAGAARGPAQILPAGHPLSEPQPIAKVDPNGWNSVEVRAFTAIRGASMSLQFVVNGIIVNTGFTSGGNGPALGRGDRVGTQPETGRFGPMALRVAGSPGAEAQFKDIKLADFSEIVPTVDKVSNGFRKQHLTSYFYGDGTCVGDLNHDGVLDVVSGPAYWAGPDFKVAREIDLTQPLDITDYARALGCEVADFTGDGWADVLETGWPGNGPMYLYVNPHNERRRWSRYKVIDSVTEIFALADLDGNGKMGLVYGGGGYPANFATPDPADPTKPWIVHHIGEQANWGSHGMGVGDINGDGRLDVLRPWGWWEHPVSANDPWKFHPVVMGRNGLAAGPGGAQMYVYDVNGDGLPDVITSLDAHGYGLAWYEQKRSPQGEISFVEHIIMDKDPALSHGVVFTELHGLTIGDVDGDGLKDIITGKNKYTYGGHYEYTYPDEEADGDLYWFKLVRKAGGQVDFVPHLIDNDSGVGRQPRAVDLNGDGVLDIVNGGRFGTDIFWGKKGVKDWTAR